MKILSKTQIIIDYDEYLHISGWAQKYSEILEYVQIPLMLLEQHQLDKDTSYLYLKGILRKIGNENAN